MEEKKNVLLISHAGDGLTKNAQTNILSSLDIRYPNIKHDRLDLWMPFEKGILKEGGEETTTRSRSFLFIALAVFAMSGSKNLKTLMIPENGLIALNIPLDTMRVGSHSTRTTHPFYLQLWNCLLQQLQLDVSVNNIFWNKTKGEMANECKNKSLLYDLIKKSFSCSSPTKFRYQGITHQHCGYCVPCLIRRAAMYKAFGEDGTKYAVDTLKTIVDDRNSAAGVQIRSFQYAIKKVKDTPRLARLYLHKSGPMRFDDEHLRELAGVYLRGMLEVDAFINAALTSEDANHAI